MRGYGAMFRYSVAILSIIVLSVSNVSCVNCVWQPPPTVTTYAIIGCDLRELKIVIFPDHQAIFWYSDPLNAYEEIALAEIRGSYPDTGKVLYEDRISVEMELQWLNSHIKGTDPSGHTNFPHKGEVTRSEIVFVMDAIRFEDMWLEQVETDSNFIDYVSSSVGK